MSMFIPYHKADIEKGAITIVYVRNKGWMLHGGRLTKSFEEASEYAARLDKLLTNQLNKPKVKRIWR